MCICEQKTVFGWASVGVGVNEVCECGESVSKSECVGRCGCVCVMSVRINVYLGRSVSVRACECVNINE